MNFLLIRGLVREKRQWGPFIDVLQKKFPKAQIHCLDLPGIGTEIKGQSPVTARGIAEDIRKRWLEVEKRSGPNYLLSISLGSMIAMEWSGLYPDDFKALVLINSSARNLSYPWERMNWKIIPALLKSVTQKDPVQREKGIIKLTTRLQKDGDALAQRWASYVNNPARIRVTALRQLRAAIRFACPEKLPVPALVLSSLQDRFTSPRCSQALAKHLGLPLCVHPEAGHDLPLDDPEWVSEQIRLFVKLL